VVSDPDGDPEGDPEGDPLDDEELVLVFWAAVTVNVDTTVPTVVVAVAMDGKKFEKPEANAGIVYGMEPVCARTNKKSEVVLLSRALELTA
jgi:hypothetical protein